MRALFLIPALAMVGCASTPIVPYVAPTVTMRGVSSEAFRAQMIQRCAKNGMSATVNTPSQIVCSRPFDESLASWSFRALALPANATNPVVHNRFNLAETGGTLVVVNDAFWDYQNAFGQKTVEPVRDGAGAQVTQRTLDELKSKLEGAAQK